MQHVRDWKLDKINSVAGEQVSNSGCALFLGTFNLESFAVI